MPTNRSLAGVLLLVTTVVLVASCRVRPAGDAPAAPEPMDARSMDPAPDAPVAPRAGSPPAQFGTASYYGHRHHGRLTANGERFDATALTAAHRTLPFGTLARVTDVSTGRQVTVRITDRGPYIRGRVIDLSYGAAKQLEMIEAGLVRVRIEVLNTGAPDFAVAAVN